MLADRGVDATQATLSRDLDELGAVKLRAADGGVGVYPTKHDWFVHADVGKQCAIDDLADLLHRGDQPR